MESGPVAEGRALPAGVVRGTLPEGGRVERFDDHAEGTTDGRVGSLPGPPVVGGRPAPGIGRRPSSERQSPPNRWMPDEEGRRGREDLACCHSVREFSSEARESVRVDADLHVHRGVDEVQALMAAEDLDFAGHKG